MAELVERDAEMRALTRLLVSAQGGEGGLAVLDAGPGLGKTALLRNLRQSAADRGFVVLSARGAELEREFAFGVVRQLFEPVLAREDLDHGELFRGAAGATRSLFGAEDPGTPGSLYPLLNGLYWLLVNLSERTPVVVLVDDAQWADLPSLQFLGFLVRRLESLRVLVAATVRHAEHGDHGLVDDLLAADPTLLRLRNLSAAAVTELVRRELGSEAHDDFCAACYAVTGGNPLFVRELLRELAADDVRPDAERAEAVVAAGPDAIRWHVAARVRRQPPAVRAVVRAVAVLGDEVALPVVAEQADLTVPEAASAAQTLTGQGIFESADPPAFVHAVVGDVARSLIPAGERGVDHERAAAVLRRAGASVTQVASHLLRTTPAGIPDRVGSLTAAALRAFQHGSPENAAVFLDRARVEPPDSALRAEISRQLGNCRAHHLATADAENHLREALALAQDSRQRGLCAYSLARFRNACGAPREAIPLLVAALDDLAEAGEPALLLEVEGELIGMARADLAGRDVLLRHLDSFAAREGRPDAVLESQWSAEALLAGRPADEALAMARSALAGDALPPERCGLWAAVNTLMVLDHLDEAERRMLRALDTVVDRGLLFPVGIVRGFLARIALQRGDLAQAEEHVELGTAAAPAPNIGLPLLESTAVHLHLEQGRLREAQAVLDKGVLSGDRAPTASVHMWLLEARTRLRLARGEHADALADAVLGGQSHERWGVSGVWDVPWRLLAAEAHREAGRHTEAVALAEQQLRLARQLAVPRHVATALRALAGLADGTDRHRWLTEAVDLLQRGQGRLDLAHTLAELSELQLRDGDRGTARATAGRAAELAAECHAPRLAERLRTGQARGGGRPRRPRVAGLPALTPSERRVARLAREALTNREIAERLFVSEKTVEAHLSRVFRKLGVRSRTELATQLTASDGTLKDAGSL
ncbi:ATP-binding protein [Actinophytocola oryzae]|uniref:Regulatory LuxR family protein n=1 Tax=Actinophytocola oryzae TaxID=502181 RepID=A0A4R7V1E4_9PSEU|nr:LuxR family transcriptional regulator [Actinophytocola oryzae]TDV43118.1 regulatory LuxR family protein [Actinophytocola oryzae]